jgi:hypothetical protein
MIYSIDSSSLIDGWNSHYPFPVFPRIWDKWFVQLISADLLQASLSVYDELEIGGDALFDWCAAHKPELFLEDTPEIQAKVSEIQANWPNPNTDFTRRLAGADLFVVSQAVFHEGVVVSSERFSGDMLHPKIPDACKHLGIECISIAEMLKRENFAF